MLNYSLLCKHMQSNVWPEEEQIKKADEWSLIGGTKFVDVLGFDEIYKFGQTCN